jgi:hypothetical protein
MSVASKLASRTIATSCLSDVPPCTPAIRDRHQAATVPFSVGDGFEIVSVPLLTD